MCIRNFLTCIYLGKLKRLYLIIILNLINLFLHSLEGRSAVLFREQKKRKLFQKDEQGCILVVTLIFLPPPLPSKSYFFQI